MTRLDPDLRRTWLFGPGADLPAHQHMLESGADVLILDLEDFTPPPRREEAREHLSGFMAGCQQHGRMAVVRINLLENDGMTDLTAAIRAQPDAIAYPMAEQPKQIETLSAALADLETANGMPDARTEIVPVCETALGVVNVRSLAEASDRVHCAILGSEDLAADLCAERGSDAVELDYARRRFVVECRAARIEPVDAPYTYADTDGLQREARYARRLGYRGKALVRPDHAAVLNAVFTPPPDDLALARDIIAGFEAARKKGEDRALVNGLWVEVPAYRNACRTVERARRLGILR